MDKTQHGVTRRCDQMLTPMDPAGADHGTLLMAPCGSSAYQNNPLNNRFKDRFLAPWNGFLCCPSTDLAMERRD